MDNYQSLNNVILILFIFEIIIMFSQLNDKRKDVYLHSCIFLNVFYKIHECIYLIKIHSIVILIF